MDESHQNENTSFFEVQQIQKFVPPDFHASSFQPPFLYSSTSVQQYNSSYPQAPFWVQGFPQNLEREQPKQRREKMEHIHILSNMEQTMEFNESKFEKIKRKEFIEYVDNYGKNNEIENLERMSSSINKSKKSTKTPSSIIRLIFSIFSFLSPDCKSIWEEIRVKPSQINFLIWVFNM